MSLFPTHNHHSYFPTNRSIGDIPTATSGTLLTSGSANTVGTWTEVHAGLTYGCDYLIARINGVQTSGGVITATTLNCYIDIGIGADSSNVTTVIEKLGGAQAQGLGVTYFIPVRMPPDIKIWARHQNTAGSAKAGLQVSWFGGNGNPGSFPSFSGMKALGATTASTTGTAVTPAVGTEGAWAQIVASTTEEYGGVMISPLFNVDTTLTANLHTTLDAGIGDSGNELTIGENLTQQQMWTSAEQKVAVCLPSFVGIPAGQRLCVRASGSATADSTNSVILYGFVH